MPNQAGQYGAAREAFRRRAQSSAGGAQGGGVERPQGPGLTPQTAMSQGGADQLQKSQPGEAMIILKALIDRWKKLMPEPPSELAPEKQPSQAPAKAPTA